MVGGSLPPRSCSAAAEEDGPALPPSGCRDQGGFALVMTLTLMVLLTVLAVGMLTLAGIALRSASQDDAMAMARANARLALMLAVGELQKSTGPDQIVTAGSTILGNGVAKPNLTGVWESWNHDPTRADFNYAAEKNSRFRRWLVSDPSFANVENKAFANDAWPDSSMVLVGEQSLGGTVDERAWARAGVVAVSTGGRDRGAYAWHVADESLKSRINFYREPLENLANLWKNRAQLAGHRPDPSDMTGMSGDDLDFLPRDLTAGAYAEALAMEGKIASLGQADLLARPGIMGQFRNEVTPYSLGVMTDVRHGGLKQDLTSLFEFGASAVQADLPAAYQNRRLYESTHGITGVSDPYWGALSTYYNTFRDMIDADSNPRLLLGSAPVRTSDPAEAPRRFFAAPLIAKVEVIFSYAKRDSEGTAKNYAPYSGHIIYTPLVTLHNPYNVNISFDRMRVDVSNVPIGFNLHVNDRPQSTALVPHVQMHVAGEARRREMSYSLEIGNWPAPDSTHVSGPVILKPGQTLVCSPFHIQPSTTFSLLAPFFNWQNDLTGNFGAPIKARPGFYGRAVGFTNEWITPTHVPWPVDPQHIRHTGWLLLNQDDQVHIQYGIVPTTAGLNTGFRVRSTLVANGQIFDYGELNFDYQDTATLRATFPQVHRYPLSGYMNFQNSYVSNDDPVSNHARAQSFALFSAHARTTSGGVYDHGSRSPTAFGQNILRNGRIAGRPYLFHSPGSPVSDMKMSQGKAGGQSYEVTFQPLPGNVDDLLEVSSDNRSNALTGNTTAQGIKSGSYFELPTGPMQTIADFRRSNALSTPFLPAFTQPVANSHVSPLMSTDRVVQSDAAIADYDLLDHPVLANHALYDRFYFSTFATLPNGAAPMTPEQTFTAFHQGLIRLPSQAFVPYVPPGKSLERARQEMFSAGRPTARAHELAAQFQLIRGPFNVNSTSVQVWKAQLSALNGTRPVVFWARDGSLELVDAHGTPVMPMSLVNAGKADNAVVDPGKIDNQRTNEWGGFRSLTDPQLQALAENIVQLVLERGPFLSLAEFVNRRVGPESPATRKGLLEIAIEAAGLNNDMFLSQIPVAMEHLSDNSVYSMNTPAVAIGNPAAGAPGWITQGDLMRILEPAATVRADTFVIRTCGETRDANGKMIARIHLEAVVQRLPGFVDPGDDPSVNVASDPAASPVNRMFGRRYEVVSFRWLAPDEI